MKIVNDCEVYEPNECYFHAMPNPEDDEEGTMIYITPIEYWNENKCLVDNLGDHSFKEDLFPEEIGNLMEATWWSELTPEEINKIMLSLGFKTSKDFSDFNSSFGEE